MMMTWSTTVRGLLGLLCVGLLAGTLMRNASAVPPPPYFNGFTIQNSTTTTVEKIKIVLTPSNPGNRGQLTTAITVQISSLPPGKSFTISPGAMGSGVEGIAKISVEAECPGGKTLTAPVEITASRADHDNNGSMEFAGFCAEAPPNKTGYPPKVEFRKKAGANTYEAHLHAKWRWNNKWPNAPVEDVKDFGP